jgi:hypothetical protein
MGRKIKKGTKVKVKGKIFPVHGMKAYRVTRGIALLSLYLGIRWR